MRIPATTSAASAESAAERPKSPGAPRAGNPAKARRLAGEARPAGVPIEDRTERRAAPDAEQRNADHEIRQVVPVGRAEEPGLSYLEEKRRGGDQPDARVAGARHRRRLRFRSGATAVKPG